MKKRLLSSLRSVAGFTMIELLVVIAIIGVLAVAVLAAMNPIEQINKGRDTTTETQIKEVLQASERYWAVNEMYPWNDTTAEVNEAFQINPNSPVEGEWDWVNLKLQSTEEFKQGFWDKFNDRLGEYGIVKVLDEDTVYGCFRPQSAQFAERALLRCATNPPTLPASAGNWICGGVVPGLAADQYVRDNVFLCLP